MKQFIIWLLSMFVLAACGPQGVQGIQGGMGEKGTTGNAGSKGTSGLPGVDGKDGKDGAQGVKGDTGANGQNGQDAIPVRFVKFCPGSDPVYPSIFPEYGLCVGGQVYAVYSANGGFGVLLPPGVYGSNGIGSSCIFKIGENCEIGN